LAKRGVAGPGGQLKSGFGLSGPMLGFLAVFYLLPVMVLLSSSLAPVEGAAWPTLARYREVLTNQVFTTILGRSFLTAAEVSLGALFLGYPVAYMISRLRTGKNLVLALVLAPLLVSEVVRTYAWIYLLGREGLLNDILVGLGLLAEPVQMLYTRMGVIVGMAQSVLPLMVLSLVGPLENIDRSLEEAAQSLGARPVTTFGRVVLPLSLPGIVAGSLLGFAATLSAFVEPELLGGFRSKMFAGLIYDQFHVAFNYEFGAAMTVILLVIGLAAIGLALRLTRALTRTS